MSFHFIVSDSDLANNRTCIQGRVWDADPELKSLLIQHGVTVDGSIYTLVGSDVFNTFTAEEQDVFKELSMFEMQYFKDGEYTVVLGPNGEYLSSNHEGVFEFYVAAIKRGFKVDVLKSLLTKILLSVKSTQLNIDCVLRDLKLAGIEHPTLGQLQFQVEVNVKQYLERMNVVLDTAAKTE